MNLIKVVFIKVVGDKKKKPIWSNLIKTMEDMCHMPKNQVIICKYYVVMLVMPKYQIWSIIFIFIYLLGSYCQALCKQL